MRCHLAAEAFHRDGDWRYKYAPMPHQVHGQQPRPRQMTTADSITFARFVLFGFVTGPTWTAPERKSLQYGYRLRIPILQVLYKHLFLLLYN